MKTRGSIGRRATALAIIAVAAVSLLPVVPAAANHLTPADYAVAQVFPTVTGQPAAVTTTLRAGTDLPVLVQFHHPSGHLFAHADSVSGVPASPVTPKPLDDDIAAQLISIGDFGLDGCAGAGDTSVPDTIPLVGFWNEPFEGAPVTDKVAELKIPTSQFPLYGAIVASPGHTGQATAHYDLNVIVPIAALACPGTTLTLNTTMLDYTRRLVAITPPTSGFPTTRIFQRHGSTAGASTSCLVYFDASNTQHDGCGAYTLTSRTDTTAPTGAFNGLTPGMELTGTPTLTVDAADNVAVAKVEFGRSGRTLGTDTSSPYQASLDTTALDDGVHAFTARIADASNNILDLAAVNAIVDNLSPSVVVATPTTLKGPVTATFNEPDMSGISSSSFVLLADGAGTPVAGTLACTNGAGGPVDCSTGPVKAATLTPAAPLIAGQAYTASLAPAGAATVVDAAGNPLAANDSAFTAALANEESTPGAVTSWARASSAAALGGSYTFDRLPGASATVPFTGTSITWHTVRGPQFGKARVLIDGTLKRTVNLYRSAPQFNHAITISGLTAGAHTMQLVPTGTKGNASGTDTRVALDAVTFGGSRRDTPAATYAWRRATAAAASGGGYAVSNLAGSAMEFTFAGTLIDWYTVRGPAMGKARIFIDGVAHSTVDNYAASNTFAVQRRISGLADATHTMRIVPTGTRNPSSSGTSVAVDRWVVG